MESNKVTLVGEIISEFQFSHEVFGEGFYIATLAVKRLSGKDDYIPLLVSERMMDVSDACIGRLIRVTGQFRSYNQQNHLVLRVFATEICFLDAIGKQEQTNEVYLDGYICKEPTYRETPLGRKIADVLLAINRPYGKSDYIPCIFWGRNALFASGLEVGDHVQIAGRIQSREYIKRISTDQSECRTAYEVSVSRLKVIEESKGGY